MHVGDDAAAKTTNRPEHGQRPSPVQIARDDNVGIEGRDGAGDRVNRFELGRTRTKTLRQASSDRATWTASRRG